jgi:LPXTG-site transpeptidase (sortase) family protein
MRPLAALMFAAMALVYVAAGVDVEGGPGPAAAGDVAPAPTLEDRVGPEEQAVPAAASSGRLPSDVASGAGADVVAAAATGRGGEAEAADDAYPVRIRIPAISVDAAVVDLGLEQDGTLEVPADFGVAGWYTGRSVPGDSGPSVVVGHVDSHTGPAVFFELSRLEVGDLIQIDRSDGLVAWFEIRELTSVDKDEFPTQRVYGDTDGPTLRLITCGGDFDRSMRSYRENLIAFADHVGNSTPAVSVERATASRPG